MQRKYFDETYHNQDQKMEKPFIAFVPVQVNSTFQSITERLIADINGFFPQLANFYSTVYLPVFSF